MKIRDKTMAILGVTFLFLFAVLMVSIGEIMIDSFDELEQKEVVKNMARATAAIDTEVTNLDRTAADWGAWDDSYYFVLGQDDEYISGNLDVETIANLQTDLMLFYDASGNLYHAEGVDIENYEKTEVSAALLDYLASQDILFEHPDPDSHHDGLIYSPEGALLIASHAITQNSREEPIAGTLVVARYLDEEMIGELEEKTQLNLNTRSIDKDNTLLANKEIGITYLNESSLLGTTVLKDISGEPVLLLDIEMKRDIYQRGQAALKYVFIAILVIGITYGLVLMASLERSVIDRLFLLNSKLSTITNEGSLSSRIEMGGNDELHELADNINYTLQALEQKEDILKTLDILESSLNSINTGIMVIDSNSKFIMNSKFIEMWNLKIPLITQNDIIKTQDHIVSQLEDGSDIRSADELFEKDTEGEKTVLKLKDGVAYDWYAGPLIHNGNRIGTVYCTSDITDGVRLQELEHENRQRLEKVLSHVICGIVIIDVENHAVVDANSIAEKIIGLPREEIIGKTCFEFLCPAKEEEECPIIDLGMTINRIERDLINKAGDRVPILKSVVPITFAGKKYLIESFVDLTKIKEAEDKLLQAKLEAESASRAKTDFLATMSHELRTPLNSVIGFSDLLAGGNVGEMTERQTKYLNNISVSGKHLLSLINNVLDLSKIEANKMELNLEVVRVNEVFMEVQQLVSPLANKKGLKLQFFIEEGISSMQVDKTRFKQILFNLISNSIKFTPEGGEINVNATKLGYRIRFTVEDTGIGIAEEDKVKLFQPFRQLESSTNRHYDGTGLGLSLTKRFVEMHHGGIWFESEVGKGTTFTFEMPVKFSDNVTKKKGSSGIKEALV